ncbi:YceI family protein [Patescibacteria group bacterium]|nr:YceI family protein [Patescibacteria group bacterium]
MIVIRGVIFRFLLTAIFLLLRGGFFDGSSVAEAHQISDAAKTITINGTSTLRDWSCVVSPLIYVHDPGNIPEAPSPNFSGVINAVVHVVVPIRDIVCENNTMTKHLRKALQWEKHPEIRFEIHQATVNGKSVYMPGDLTIAGITRNVALQATLNDIPDGWTTLSGTITIDMRDYHVEPPVISLLLFKAEVKPEIALSFSVSTPSWRNPTKTK